MFSTFWVFNRGLNVSPSPIIKELSTISPLFSPKIVFSKNFHQYSSDMGQTPFEGYWTTYSLHFHVWQPSLKTSSWPRTRTYNIFPEWVGAVPGSGLLRKPGVGISRWNWTVLLTPYEKTDKRRFLHINTPRNSTKKYGSSCTECEYT